VTLAQWSQLVFWQDDQVEHGRRYLVIAVGPRPGVAFFAVRRELVDDSEATRATQARLGRRELAKTLMDVADKIEGQAS
jgi:hypothetical protein